ncbi:unnamed protein product [Scytosiphon promiscuus]
MSSVEDTIRERKCCGGGDSGSSSDAWGVYCHGPLLEAIQSARLFPDSKTFVDMPMKQDPNIILAAFDGLSVLDRKDPVKLARFVSEYFDEAGSDIVPVTPRDFCPNPSFLEGIEHVKRREWARSIHGLWALLVRENVADVDVHPQRHSLLQRRHPVIVPGGRFRESYYWDTFWTIRGLVVSGMVDTARGAVLNLLDDVDRFGFVPNGGRLYYTTRSQPPLLSDMVCEIYSAEPTDREFVARALPSLEAEHAFWMDFGRGRAVHVPHSPDSPVDGPVLNRYWGVLDPPSTRGPDDDATTTENSSGAVGGPLLSRSPRPESYREDAEAALGKCACGGGGGAGGGICHELAAAAESGWDFSSRWAGVSSRDGKRETKPWLPEGENGVGRGAREKQRQQQKEQQHRLEGRRRTFCLCQSAATSVVPVDLNAFLHRAELNIARLHHVLHAAADETEHANGPRGRGTGQAVEGDEEPSESPLPPLLPLLSVREMQRQFLCRLRIDGGGGGGNTDGGGSGLLEGKLVTREDEVQSVPGESSGGDNGVSDEPPVLGGSRPLCGKTVLFAAAARTRAEAMEKTMWDEGSGLWRDLLLPTGEQSSTITPACFVPMWAGLPWPMPVGSGNGNTGGRAGAPTATQEDQDEDEAQRLERCVGALRRSGLVQPGGVRTSLEESGQQWDGRNAWPPLQWMLIQGLRRWGYDLTHVPPTRTPFTPREISAAAKTRSMAATEVANSKAPAGAGTRATPPAAAASAKSLALEMEEAFLNGALAGWVTTGGMMEKYDADETGKGGGGGEYSLQIGFGWTNGVALDLLAARSQASA